jgi:hypothetical protein
MSRKRTPLVPAQAAAQMLAAACVSLTPTAIPTVTPVESPQIDRWPVPGEVIVHPLDSLPARDPNSSSARQVDLRMKD